MAQSGYAEEGDFDYGIFLTPKSLLLFLYNLIFFLFALFFGFNMAEILAVLLVEGIFMTFISCVLVALFPRFTISSFKRIVRNVDWNSRSARLLTVLKVFLVSVLFLSVFFCISYGIVSIFGGQSLDPGFLQSANFKSMLLVVGALVCLEVFFSVLSKKNKQIKINYGYITGRAGMLALFSIFFVLFVMFYAIIAWIFPLQKEVYAIILLGLLFLIRYLISLIEDVNFYTTKNNE